MNIAEKEVPLNINTNTEELKAATKNREDTPNRQIIALMILVERLEERITSLESRAWWL